MLDDGELQDLAHSVKACMHFGNIHFRSAIASMVSLGETIANFKGTKELKERFLEEAKLTPADVEASLGMHRLYSDFKGFTDERWAEIQNYYLEALVRVPEACNRRIKPQRRWRAARVVAKLPKPIVQFAILSWERKLS